MRLLSFLAVLSAVLSAGAAQACCFFKCFGKGSAASEMGTAETARMRPTAGYAAPSLEIFTVGGFAPDSTWNIATALPPGQVEVIVEADPYASWASSIDLYVTDLGAIGSAVRAATGEAAKGEKKRYKAKKVQVKLKQPKQVGAAAAATPGATATWVLEMTYAIDVVAGHNYSAYAQGEYWEWVDYWARGTATSHTVTFHTKAAVTSPPSPPPTVPALKK